MKAHNARQRVLEAHGPLTAKAYTTWVAMRSRCGTVWPKDSPNACYNGLKCEFPTFESFLIEVGIPRDSKLSIDRIDGKKGYLPGNVRWATAREQRHNTRSIKLDYETADKVRAKYAEGKLSQAEIAADYKISQGLVSKIIRNEIWTN